MLINPTYFAGELSITNLNTPAIQERVKYFIEKYEPILLKDVLGYPLYSAFMTGLQIQPLSLRWQNLILGDEYTTVYGTHKWNGLITISQEMLNLSYSSNPVTVIVGRGGVYDPLPAGNTTIIPDAILGKSFQLEQRYTGTLRKDEYTVIGNVLTLLNNVIFSLGDTFFYKISPLQFATATSDSQKSLIANYVYYMYMRDEATQSSAVGEVIPKTENATRVSPAQKMVSAWNEMSEQIQCLWHYLNASRATFPEWQYYARSWSDYRTINIFGI